MTSGDAAAGLRARAASLRVGGVAVLVAGVAATLDPHRTHVPLCPFHAVTGLDCPLCGSLRAVHDLSRLRVAAAVHDNLLLVLALPALALWWALWFGQDGSGRRRPQPPRAVTVLLVAVSVLFAVVRNSPFGAALHST